MLQTSRSSFPLSLSIALSLSLYPLQPLLFRVIMQQPAAPSSSRPDGEALPEEAVVVVEGVQGPAGEGCGTAPNDIAPAPTEEANEPSAVVSSPRSSASNKTPTTAIRIHRRTDDEQAELDERTDANTSPLQARVKSPLSSAALPVLSPRLDAEAGMAEHPSMHVDAAGNAESNRPVDEAATSSATAQHEAASMTTGGEQLPAHGMQWPQRRLFTLEEERSKDLSSGCLDATGEHDGHSLLAAQHSAQPANEHMPPSAAVEMHRYLSQSEANSFNDSDMSVPVEVSTSVIVEESTSQFGILGNLDQQQQQQLLPPNAVPIEPSPDIKVKQEQEEEEEEEEDKQTQPGQHTPIRQDHHRE
ncbi:hypothetical protein SYNPS1DRAFT_31675, partial [Syncephalis pseudoplumigaleata]